MRYLLIILLFSLPAKADNYDKWQTIRKLPIPEVLFEDTSVQRMVDVKENIKENFQYIEDDKSDIWKTPAQFRSDNGGDCEDIAIYTAFELMKYGFDRRDMKLLVGTKEGKYHAVLYYQKGRQKIIFDNQYSLPILEWRYRLYEGFETLQTYKF